MDRKDTLTTDVLRFGVGEDVRLEVGGLGELFVAAVERTDVGPVARVDAHVRPEVEVERETLAAALERALERLLARVHQLVPLELGRLDEGLAALGAHVDARPVRAQELAHRRIVAEHLGAALVRTRDRPDRVFAPPLLLRLHPVPGPNQFALLQLQATGLNH